MRAIVSEGTAWATVNVQRLPGLALAVGCLMLLAHLFGDQRYFVYHPQVTGYRLLTPQAIYEASGVDMHSIFFIAPAAVEQRLLERFPSLEQVRVALGLPAELRIHVVEKKVSFVCEAEGQRYLVDESGTILGGGVALPEALVIRCAEGRLPGTGETLDLAVLETAATLSSLLGGVRTFEYSPRFGVSWVTQGGWPVHFGVGGDLAGKVAVMRSMLADLAEKGITPEFLDVGVPSRPYYR
ncbi:MAG: FtsQ-type POTRA domain-containing protein [Anaerolineae bacterium]|nr:FtsQ-type POTRA domain-containing protein [Anaerolineae bacterium]